MGEVVVAIVAVVLPVFLLWRLSTTRPSQEGEMHDAKPADEPTAADEIAALLREGDGNTLLEHLEALSVDQYVPIATALGRYEEAVSVATPMLPALTGGGPLWELFAVNAAEPLSELGRYDEALALLEAPSEWPLAEGGRRCTRAWILSMCGSHDEALSLLGDVQSSALDEYECELWLTRAFVHRKRGAVDACESALHHASRTAVRASSKRNLEFEWAELHRARGDFPRALAHYEAAAKHHWRWQGGSGLLNWGTLLQQLGRTDEARAAWTQCLEQDPQSLAAREAQRLLSSSSQEPEPAAP